MPPAGIGTSGRGGHGAEAPVQQIAFLSALVAIWACWPLVRGRVPVPDRFAMADLVREHWARGNAADA